MHTVSLTPRRRAPLLFALTLGGFAIGTSEFSMMGLMPELAAGFMVSEPHIGHLISAYALGVVVGAPGQARCSARACPGAVCCSR